MKNEVLQELIDKWNREAKHDDLGSDGSKDAEITNASIRGQRNGQRMCAIDLEALIKLLG